MRSTAVKTARRFYGALYRMCIRYIGRERNTLRALRRGVRRFPDSADAGTEARKGQSRGEILLGIIFNIQRFSVHDGPGIRTTVFLKGCNLDCRWCHNPESISGSPQLQYFAEKCVGCGLCGQYCPRGITPAQRIGGAPDGCVLCGRCAAVCMEDALKIAGVEKSADEIIGIVKKDLDYYNNSGGGVTVSGGEPLLQPEFTAEIFEKAKEAGINTALDIAGNVAYGRFKTVLPYTDIVLFDLKMFDSALHREYTGADNTRILANLSKLFDEDVDIYIRIPLMKGVNDTDENISRTADFVNGAANVRQVDLLPYHALGSGKSQSIGRHAQDFKAPDSAVLERLGEYFKAPVKW